MNYPDATYLRALKRSELQRLAREHSVKANLKSKVIIDVLLQRFSEAKKIQSRGNPLDAQQATAAEVNARTQVPKSSISVATRSIVHRATPYAVSDMNDENLESLGTERESRIAAASLGDAQSERIAEATSPRHDPCHDTTYPDSPPDFSKREDLPAVPCLVEETVAILAEIDRDNEKIMKRIMKLRAGTTELRSRAKAVRDVVRAEDFNRVRMLTYLTYWQPVDDGWSYHEVWSGEMKIRHPNDFVGVTTSDEEDMEEDNEAVDNDLDAVRVGPRSNSPAQSDESTADKLERARPPVNTHPAINGITTAESSNTILRLGQKRLHRDTVDGDLSVDDLRYTPRRRSNNNDPDTPEREIITIKANPLEALEYFSPPSTPTPRRVNKGKKKMTVEQVQTLENEHAAERFLAEILASNPRLQPGAVGMNTGEASMTTEQVIPGFEPEHGSTQVSSGFILGPDGHHHSCAGAQDVPHTSLASSSASHRGTSSER